MFKLLFVYRSQIVSLIMVISIIVMIISIHTEEKPSCVITQDMVCRRNMCQLLYAIQIYKEAHGNYPPLHLTNKNGVEMHSWRSLILPYLECNEYDLTEPWNGPKNSILSNNVASLFRCPSDVGTEASTSYLMYNDMNKQEQTQSYVIIIESYNSGVPVLKPEDISLCDIQDESRTPYNEAQKKIPRGIHCVNGKTSYFHIGYIGSNMRLPKIISVDGTIKLSELHNIIEQIISECEK